MKRDSAAAVDTLAILATVLEIEAVNAQQSLAQLASKAAQRTLGADPNSSVTAKYLREPRNAANVPTVMRMNEVAIAPEHSSIAKADPVGSPVQSPRLPRKTWKPKTKRSRDMLQLIESLPEPWTTTRVARAYALTEPVAKYWLNLFAAKLGWTVESGPGGGYKRSAK